MWEPEDSVISVNGNYYLRIPHRQNEVCPECGASNCEQHYPGCGVEICPVCKEAALTCECGVAWVPAALLPQGVPVLAREDIDKIPLLKRFWKRRRG